MNSIFAKRESRMNYTYYKSLGLIARKIARKIGEQLVENLQENAIDIKADQWSVISMLRHKRESSQKNISLEFGYDKVMVMRIVQSLIDKGLVTKKICKNDKRTRIITLTEAGDELYKRIEPIAEKTIREAIRSLSVREVEFYVQISETIINNLDRKSG
jgi:DNA-binding MarR family transcriptional regulator